MSSAKATCVGALTALEARYTWFGHVSSGTYGSVYAGKSNTAPFDRIAAKVVPGNANGTMCVALRELRASLCAAHAGIVAPKEVHVFADSTVVFIMSLYDGTVRDVITRHNNRRPRFAMREVAWIFASVARALREAHRYGFTHRDIKPENIFVRDGDICLGDWGLGRDNVLGRGKTAALSPHVISTWYAPPEVLRASTAYSPSVDVWSIGMLLLELLADTNLSRTARRETFFDDTITRLVGPVDGKRRLEHIRNTLRRDVAGDIIDLLSAMLAYEPAARPTVEEVCCHRFVADVDVTATVSFPVISNRITRTRYNCIQQGPGPPLAPFKIFASFVPRVLARPCSATRFPQGMFQEADLLRAWQAVARLRQAHECWVLVLAMTHALRGQLPYAWARDISALQTLGVFFLLAFHSVVVTPQHITTDKLRLCDGLTWETARKAEQTLMCALHGAVPHAPDWFARVPRSRPAHDLLGTVTCLVDAPFSVLAADLVDACTAQDGGQTHPLCSAVAAYTAGKDVDPSEAATVIVMGTTMGASGGTVAASSTGTSECSAP